MAKQILYSNIKPPARLKRACEDASYYVPDTSAGHKVASIIEDPFATAKKLILFKYAQETETEDLGEAYIAVKKEMDALDKKEGLSDSSSAKKDSDREVDGEEEDEEGGEEEDEEEDEEGGAAGESSVDLSDFMISD